MAMLLPILVMALIAVISSSAMAQDTRTVRNSDGRTVFTLNYYGTGQTMPYGGGTSTYTLSTTQKDAIERAFVYWTERIAPAGWTGNSSEIHVGTMDGRNAWGGGLGYNTGPYAGYTSTWVAISEGVGTGVGLTGYGRMDWNYDLNGQIQEAAGNSMEAVALHEVGHILGISQALPWMYHVDAIGIPISDDFLVVDGWHEGPTARAVYGDSWLGGAGRDVPLQNGWFSDPNILTHIDVNNSLMSWQGYRNYTGFMEVELATMVDMPYSINLRQFFGRSIYRDDQTVNYTGGYYHHDGANYVTGRENTAR